MLWENASESGGLHRIPHPEPRPARRLRIFELFPILLAIAFNWIIPIIVTEAGHYDNSDATTQANCRTDQSDVLSHSPWIRFPYPGQWGGPIFTGFGVVACLAGALSAMVESVGPQTWLRPLAGPNSASACSCARCPSGGLSACLGGEAAGEFGHWAFHMHAVLPICRACCTWVSLSGNATPCQASAAPCCCAVPRAPCLLALSVGGSRALWHHCQMACCTLISGSVVGALWSRSGQVLSLHNGNSTQQNPLHARHSAGQVCPAPPPKLGLCCSWETTTQLPASLEPQCPPQPCWAEPWPSRASPASALASGVSLPLPGLLPL